ncbi:MAG: DnaJ domain-containing protein [Anaerolineae bacterium]
MSSLHIAFHYLVDRLHEVKTVKHVRVKDEGALSVELEQPGFIENVVIYLLAGELSLGFIKKAINANTRADVNTLFIVSSDLLPDHNATVQPSEAMRLLLDLYAGKIYAYSVVGAAVRIFPVYVSKQHHVTHGAPVEIANLSIDYAEIYSNHIWGVRKIADFTARQFHKTVSRSDSDPLQPFYDLLDIPLTASKAEVKHAYRVKARQHHPDTDKSPDATRKMQNINEAYARIMRRFGD